MVIALVSSFAGLFSVSSSAADHCGDASSKIQTNGGLGHCASALEFSKATYAFGNEITYVIDRQYFDNLSQLGEIYTVAYWLNACSVDIVTSTSNSAYSLSQTLNCSLTAGANTTVSNSVAGVISGPVPEAKQTITFEVYANIHVFFYPSSSRIPVDDSAVTTFKITLIGVDSAKLNEEITTFSDLRESCWTPQSWSTYKTAVDNGKKVLNDVTSIQSDIDLAAETIKETRNALVHAGNQDECEYCMGPGGNTIVPTLFTNVQYGDDPVRQSLNVCIPKNARGDVSLILHIHGGGWLIGDKDTYGTDMLKNECSQYGIASAALSYRYLSFPSITADSICDDITSCLAKIKEIGEKNGINITKVMLTGESAGGHLSLLYGYSRRSEAPITPVCVFERCGPVWLCNRKYLTNCALGDEKYMSVLLSMLCGVYFTPDNIPEEALAALMRVSPINYIEKAIPTVICHGQKDSVVHYSEGQYLDEYLTKAGVTHTYISFPNSDHDLANSKDAAYNEYANQMYDQYIQNYLLGGIGHTHDYKLSGVKEATCTEDGARTFTCSCGSTFDKTVKAKGHTAGEWEESKPATCLDEGEKVKKCITCKEILETDVIPTGDHTPGEWEVTVKATCTQTGTKVQKCIVCKKTLNTDIVELAPHVPGEWETKTSPSCTATGEKVKKCQNCHLVLESDTLPLAEHIPGDWEEYTPASCTSTGVKVKKCQKCTLILDSDDIEKLPHQLGEWTVITPATVDEEGLEGRYCDECKQLVEQRAIEKIQYEITPDESSDTIIDTETGLIYGLEEGIMSLDGFVKCKGCTLKLNPTDKGFGTGSTVEVQVNGVTMQTLTVAIIGDVTGDGFVDAFDVSDLAAVANFETEYPDSSAFAFAGDVINDGFIDSFDLVKLISAANYEIVMPQTK